MRAAATPPAVALPVSDRSGHVGDQDVSAQIVQPSDALGATDPLAQRTLPRSASKHPDCRSRTGAGVDHADHIAAELERFQHSARRGVDHPTTRLVSVRCRTFRAFSRAARGFCLWAIAQASCRRRWGMPAVCWRAPRGTFEPPRRSAQSSPAGAGACRLDPRPTQREPRNSPKPGLLARFVGPDSA